MLLKTRIIMSLMTNSAKFPALENLPDWACWLAQDADGCWWIYEVEPLQYHQGWYENELGKRTKLGCTEPVKNWQNMLFRVSELGIENTPE